MKKTLNMTSNRPPKKGMKVINVLDFYENRIGSRSPESKIDQALRVHSDLAMAAAKKMRRSRCKEKTGHLVCAHWLDMLSEEKALVSAPHAASSIKASSVKTSRTRELFTRESSSKMVEDFEETGFWSGSNFIKSGDGRQFSLSL